METNKQMSQLQKRVEARDAAATKMLGQCYIFEEHGLPTYVAKGIKLWKEAARLGDVKAHYNLAILYDYGNVRVKKDTEKMLHHFEVAAIGSQFEARHNLVVFEYEEGRTVRALRHFMMSAKMGYEDSLECILELHKRGCTNTEFFRARFGRSGMENGLVTS